MEIDTRASCFSLTKFKELGQLKDVEDNLVKLRTYTGEIGEASWVKVSNKGTESNLPLLVMKGDVPTLLGHNWL